MNECVKTGVVFRDMTEELTRVGDLKFRDGRWLITGSPHGLFDTTPHIVVRGLRTVARRGEYEDFETEGLVSVSDSFSKFVSLWYPELAPIVDAVPRHDGVATGHFDVL